MKKNALIVFLISLFICTNVYADSTHIVKKGDTLYKIAKKHNISEKELKSLNNLKTSKLKIGQKLALKKSETGTTAPAQAVSRQNNPEPKTYRVKKGDNIWKIARRFDLTADELKEINGLQDNLIKPGQKLLLAKRPSELKEVEQSLNVLYDRLNTPVIAASQQNELQADVSGNDNLKNLGIRDRLTLFAKKMLDIPYKFGGNTSFGIDCSAYVQKAYSIIGLDLPRTAREQFHVGEAVNKEHLDIGDLVFFKTYASFPSHVGIYLGNNLFIHASSKSKKVTIDSLDTPYYLKRFIGAKRLISEEDMAMGREN